jgi:hypothetical protein
VIAFKTIREKSRRISSSFFFDERIATGPQVDISIALSGSSHAEPRGAVLRRVRNLKRLGARVVHPRGSGPREAGLWKRIVKNHSPRIPPIAGLEKLRSSRKQRIVLAIEYARC